MNFPRFIAKLAACLVVCLSLAAADSIQLRNGRHLQGKYIGGTTSTIGFMAGANVEYFSTTDVLVLIFDGGNDSLLREVQPNPMKAPAWRRSDHVRLIRASGYGTGAGTSVTRVLDATKPTASQTR